MSRTLVNAPDIAQWLTESLRKVEDCQDCAVSGVVALQEPEADGCNWSDSLTVNSGGVSLDYYGPYLAKLIAEARLRFNLL